MDYEDAQGALAGDSTARRVQSVIRSTTTGIQNLEGNVYTALSDIGITSDRYGQLALDSSKFQAALSANPDDLRTFFRVIRLRRTWTIILTQRACRFSQGRD